MSPAVTRTRVYSILENAECTQSLTDSVAAIGGTTSASVHQTLAKRRELVASAPFDDFEAPRRSHASACRRAAPRLSSTASRRVNQPERECTSTPPEFQPGELSSELQIDEREKRQVTGNSAAGGPKSKWPNSFPPSVAVIAL